MAEVVLNRVDSPRYPKTVCGVVQQRGSGSCAFSYSCDGNKDVMTDRSSAEVAGRIARVMLDGAPRALTAGATYFHTRAVSPSWSRQVSAHGVPSARICFTASPKLALVRRSRRSRPLRFLSGSD